MPTTEEKKDELFEAGLGEKEILFDELDLPAEEFKEVVLHSFPQLRQAGGYQLCKCIPNSTIVKGGFIIAVCIYIQLMDSCIICGLKVELSYLPEHIELCKSIH